MGVASGCDEQEVGVASGSGWNLWMWLLGVVVRRYIDFLILLIPTPIVSVLFYSSIPTFCSFIYIYCIIYYIMYCTMYCIMHCILYCIRYFMMKKNFTQKVHVHRSLLHNFHGLR